MIQASKLGAFTRLRRTVFLFAVDATVAYAAFDIADEGLPTIVHMDVLDTHNLLTAVPQASKNLHLHRIRPEQTSRS